MQFKHSYKPYHLLLGTAILFFILSFFNYGSLGTLDIHMHDSYLVLGYSSVLQALAILSLMILLLYLVNNPFLYSATLSKVHIGVTICTFILFAFSLFIDQKGIATKGQKHYYDISAWGYFSHLTTGMKILMISIAILVAGQLIFVVNLIAGLLKIIFKQKS